MGYRVTAGRRVGQLFQGRAVTAIANDCILMLALQELIVLLSFAMGFVLGIVCAMTLISGTDTVETHIGPLIFGAMVIALPMASMAEMVRSGFKTVFVCFVHHPEALARNHDQRLHEGLNAAWNEINARSNQVVVGQNAHPYASASVV